MRAATAASDRYKYGYSTARLPSGRQRVVVVRVLPCRLSSVGCGVAPSQSVGAYGQCLRGFHRLVSLVWEACQQATGRGNSWS